jgi:DeoR/GlpR family transcriptional regulator of sugar metabolism
MIPEQRHQEILRLLRQEGILRVRNLTAYMNVSDMTVRRDITALEAQWPSDIRPWWRSAIAEWNCQEAPRELEFRAQPGLPREKAIAELAAETVEDDMVVFLDAGTTCQLVVPFLAARQHLTVVTNDFYIVTSLFDYPNIETIHHGGAVDPTSASSYGRLADRTNPRTKCGQLGPHTNLTSDEPQKSVKIGRKFLFPDTQRLNSEISI